MTTRSNSSYKTFNKLRTACRRPFGGIFLSDLTGQSYFLAALNAGHSKLSCTLSNVIEWHTSSDSIFLVTQSMRNLFPFLLCLFKTECVQCTISFEYIKPAVLDCLFFVNKRSDDRHEKCIASPATVGVELCSPNHKLHSSFDIKPSSPRLEGPGTSHFDKIS